MDRDERETLAAQAHVEQGHAVLRERWRRAWEDGPDVMEGLVNSLAEMNHRQASMEFRNRKALWGLVSDFALYGMDRMSRELEEANAMDKALEELEE